MDTLDQLALALGFATLSGLNLYLTALVTGLAIRFELITLHDRYADLAVLAEPAVLGIAGGLFILEFFADKIPWVDSFWDGLQTFIRPAGGAFLALSALGQTSPALDVIIALLAGSATLVTHSFKAGTRLAINASPEPISNIAASTVEDVAVVGGSILMWTQPVIALVVFGGALLAIITIAPRMMRRIRAACWLMLRKLRLPGNGSADAALPTTLTAEEDLALSVALDLPDPDPAWAVPAVAARFPGLPTNRLGKLVSERSNPGALYFVARKGRATVAATIPIAEARFSHESRFLCEEVVVHNKKSAHKAIIRFSRADGERLERLLQTFEREALASSAGESPPDGGGTAEPAPSVSG